MGKDEIFEEFMKLLQKNPQRNKKRVRKTEKERFIEEFKKEVGNEFWTNGMRLCWANEEDRDVVQQVIDIWMQEENSRTRYTGKKKLINKKEMNIRTRKLVSRIERRIAEENKSSEKKKSNVSEIFSSLTLHDVNPTVWNEINEINGNVTAAEFRACFKNSI